MSSKTKAARQYAKAVDFYNEGSHEKAIKWYRKAAERGHADAQANLGAMYAIGLRVTKSDTESEKWYRKAAEQGHPIAQDALKDIEACK